MSASAILACALLFAGMAPPGVEAQASSVRVPPNAAVRVDSIFRRWDTPTSPGCAVGVALGGLRVLERAYGMADLEHGVANTPETIFEGGSVSKQFTAAAVILLEMDGKLSLDDDVRRYVPELPDYGHTITLRHLITHTSGLRDWGSVAAISGWGREQRTHDHDWVLDILSRQSALNFPPGSERIGKRRTVRTPEAGGEMKTRWAGRVRNGRWGGFLRAGGGGLEIPGAPGAGREGLRGQAPQLWL